MVEALYTFPVPKGASVANFSMWINGKEMVGEVVEKQRAREIYDSYKQMRRDPGLLEQVDYRTLRDAHLPDRGRRRAAGADHLLPGTRLRPRLGDLRLSAGHRHAQRMRDQRTTGTFAFSARREERGADRRAREPSHGDEFAVVRNTPTHYWQASLETSGGDLSRDVVHRLPASRGRGPAST